MKRKTIPLDPDGKQNPSWRFHEWDDGRVAVLMRCSAGHEATLAGHEVRADGAVHPSLVCHAEGCGYHEWGRLEGWPARIKPAGKRFLDTPGDDHASPDRNL